MQVILGASFRKPGGGYKIKSQYIGSGTSFNLTGFEGWQNFTLANFQIVPYGPSGGSYGKGSGEATKVNTTFSYDANTGILNASISTHIQFESFQAYACHAYLLLPDNS